MILATVAAHAGVLFVASNSPAGFWVLPALNAVIALALLLYSASRARYLLATRDRRYLVLVLLEMTVLAGAICAFRANRPAAILSWSAFGLHGCASLLAAYFAFIPQRKVVESNAKPPRPEGRK